MQTIDSRIKVALWDLHARLIRTRKMDEKKMRDEIEKLLNYLDTLRHK